MFSDNKLEAEKQFGRYVAIDPTATSSDESDSPQQTRQSSENFLAERGRQARQKSLMHLSRPLFNNSAMPMESVSNNNLSHVNPSVPRQQNNPDIQDIITGIVNLLNGNVNVHANGQGNRRPPNNRINNRGPPRISEAQVPNDEQNQNNLNQNNNGQNNLPFERPESSLPVRPFLTGVPLPEQIVPSMQQNLRPGFISQNRPPWKRPNPRPSNTFHRRPILQPHPQQIPTHYGVDKVHDGVLTNNKNVTSALNSNNNNYHQPQHEIGINNIESEEEEEVEEENVEKHEENERPTKDAKNEISPTTVVTIIQSTSEVNTIQKLTDSSEIINTLSSDTSSSSSSVGVSSSSNTLEASFSSDESSSSSSVVTQAPVIKTSSIETSAVTPTASVPQFHPRPGVVLDDPEFKPGQKTNHHHRQQQQQHHHYRPPIQQQPDGIPEIFDVTLSAIQGPSGNTGSQQTINIKPYNYDGTDILLAPSGDQGFVSIDGKRTYINLLGESTNAPQHTNSQIQPTKSYNQLPGITGTGTVEVETEPTTTKKHPFSHQQQQQQNNRPITRPKFPAAPLQQPSIPVRIDTCIVGDDSTCDQTQNEKCKTENGVSSCNCKPGKFVF